MKHLVYVGFNGFPFGFAQVERQKLIAKALNESGIRVTIINRFGVHARKAGQQEIPGRGYYGDIKFIYASGSAYREGKFIKRNLLKIKGFLNEIRVIWSLKKHGEIDAILINSNSFFNVLFYGIMGYCCKVVSLLDYVEYWRSMSRSKSIFKKANGFLYDKYSYKCVSKVIVISDFLGEIVKTNSPGTPVIKIPAIVDYEKIDKIGPNKNFKKYLIYCGGAGYAEVIDFIIRSFESLNSDFDLVIVAHGDAGQLAFLKKIIDGSTRKEQILLKTDLPYEELITIYKSSAGLLIPLRESLQDMARFPHKVGEYCASGRPIISTNIGEMKNYFTDMENAFLAENYDYKKYAEKMKTVIENDLLANEIGARSYQLGMQYFNYKSSGKKLYEFIFN
jgi:glycosyltransferase involved in cell wall biosynthesis